MVFHFVHSASHIFSVSSHDSHLESLYQDYDKAESVESQAQWLGESATDACFVCDSFLSPFISSEILIFKVIDYQIIEKVCALKALKYPTLNFVYFSLRAPPMSLLA